MALWRKARWWHIRSRAYVVVIVVKNPAMSCTMFCVIHPPERAQAALAMHHCRRRRLLPTVNVAQAKREVLLMSRRQNSRAARQQSRK